MQDRNWEYIVVTFCTELSARALPHKRCSMVVCVTAQSVARTLPDVSRKVSRSTYDVQIMVTIGCQIIVDIVRVSTEWVTSTII